MRQRTVEGAEFLRLLLQHVLPKGLRRARCYGFLHPNARRLAALLKPLVFKVASAQSPPAERATLRCGGCGAPMRVVLQRTTPPQRAAAPAASLLSSSSSATPSLRGGPARQDMFAGRPSHAQRAAHRACPTNASDRGFARSILDRYASVTRLIQ
ncbi:MAG: transposase [Betaproteobacteria bacterium]|nr:transposase [Betaproteobacteria bacterium]